MKIHIKNSYKKFITLVVFLLLIFPNTIWALGPETKNASSITKDKAYLNGYYFDINGGFFGNNKSEFVNFVYSKNSTIKCTELYKSGKKTSLQEVKSTKSSYNALIGGLENETDYYFCFILYELNNGGFGSSKYYAPIAYGEVLSFKTLKGFVSKSKQTQTSGVTKRTVGPDKIGNVSTYEASRTTDTEALFSGNVDRLEGEAHAYFRYAVLDKPPVFCNDIYGSAQRSAIASRPNPYGIISKGGGEAYIRAEIEKAKINKQKVINEQNKIVEQARLNLMNSQPFLVEKIKGDPKAVAPIIDGYYTRPNDLGGVIYISVGARVGGNKFPDFTYSGMVSGKGNVQSPEILGNTGLELNFYTFPYIENSEWKLTIPNKNSPSYNANLNAYNQALANRTKAIADADADIADLEAELQRALQGISGGASFSTVVRDLSPNTTYYYCAIVSNSAVNPTEIEYGPVKSFRTLPCQTCPQTEIETTRVVNISSNTATLYGKYGSVPQLEVYFEYKKETDTEWKKTNSHKPPVKTYGNFWEPVSSLSKSTVYQFRAVGEATTFPKTGSGGPTSKIYYGDTLTFKTNSGNLFDSLGWSEEPDLGNPGGGNDGTIDGEEADTGRECEPNCDEGTDGTCDDGIKNGDETGIDKGGRCGKKGPDAENPVGCEPNCDIVIPPLPTCFDGIQNGNETGIDTGGWCGGGNDGNCFDGIKNGDETGVDTGGRCFFGGGNNGSGGYNGGGNGGGGSGGGGGGSGGSGNGGNVIVITGGGSVSNSGGTTISSGGTTVISGGTTTTTGGTTTISGGSTNINGQNTNINNGIATNTGGTATTSGGTTTLRGGTTTITYKDANGNTQTFITNGEVKVVRSGDTNIVTFKDANGNTQTIVIKDGEGQITNVGGVRTTENGNTVLRGGRSNVLDNRSGPRLGDRLTPPSDAIVRYHEGIETVFTRQIMRNLSFARLYGYDDSMNLQNFADTLSHTFAKEYFGYIDASGLEVRVSKPDVSAYELRQVGGVLTVYEYYENVIVDIRNTTTIFKNKNPYEYYDRRRR